MVVIGLFGLASLAGCTTKIPLEDHNKVVKQLNDKNLQLNNELTNLHSQLNELSERVKQGEATQAELELVKKKLAEQEARDAQIIADYKEELAKFEAENKVTEAKMSGEYDVTDDLVLGQGVADYNLDNNELGFLSDTQIEFLDEDVDVQEKIMVKGLAVETNLKGDSDFEAKPVLTFDVGMEYRYIFDDNVNYTLITEDDNLVITMLGKEYNIIDMTATSFTFIEGIDYPFAEGETKEVNGKQVTLLTVGNGNEVYVDVDGVAEIVKKGGNEEINGLNVRVKELIYTGKDSGISYATLTVGDDVEQTIDNGDEFIKDNDKFEWVIDTTGDMINYIGVKLVEKQNNADEEILYPEETMSFAGLFNVVFDVEREYDYADFDISFDEIQVNNNDIKVVEFDSKDGKKLIIGDEEVEKAYYNGTTIFYKDNDNKWVEDTTNVLKLENDDVSYEVGYNDTAKKLFVGVLELDLQKGFDYFGVAEGEAESTDLVVDGVKLGGRDNDVLLEDGTVIFKPENNLDDDKVKISLPDKKVETIIKIGKD